MVLSILTNLAFEFAKERKIVTNHQGDWLTGERGRTLYIGSKSSVALKLESMKKVRKKGVILIGLGLRLR